MLEQLENKQLETLLRRIDNGRCTPFIGAGACAHTSLPMGGKIAKTWADEVDYPMENKYDLPRVAQFLAVQYGDNVAPKEKLLETWFTKLNYPNFTTEDEPHGVLANFPLPIYITTNYDDFMIRALMSCGKNPHRELCRWNSLIRHAPSVFADPAFEPNAQNPVVFHLHGHSKIANSLVLTEDDYIDFLIQLSRERDVLLPPRIQQALAETSLLFIGYSLRDLNFRVLFRGILNSVERRQKPISFTLQFPDDEYKDIKAQEYIAKYLNREEIKVVWGDAQDFISELNKKYKGFKNGS